MIIFHVTLYLPTQEALELFRLAQTPEAECRVEVASPKDVPLI